MRRALVTGTVALAFLSVALMISGAQAGSSQSAPTKYSNQPNRVVAASAVWTGLTVTRRVGMTEFSSSAPRAKSPPRR